MSEYRSYAEYLADPRYRRVRRIAMNRAGWRCQRCGNPATEVHHVRYPPWGTFDVPENLMPICHACHCAEHGKDD
jgi:HNH endonuclease